MNPEFQRNLWLELTPRRITLMVGVAGARLLRRGGFRATRITARRGPPRCSITSIVVIWGARNAAMAVVGEIRDRTWDMQLLSSIGAGRDDLGQAVRRDDLQLVRRRDLPRASCSSRPPRMTARPRH